MAKYDGHGAGRTVSRLEGAATDRRDLGDMESSDSSFSSWRGDRLPRRTAIRLRTEVLSVKLAAGAECPYPGQPPTTPF